MTMKTKITDLPPRPTQEQQDRWPSCRIIALLHDMHVAMQAADSTQAQIQLRQAITMTGRAMLAQVQAESYDGRRLPLEEAED